MANKDINKLKKIFGNKIKKIHLISVNKKLPKKIKKISEIKPLNIIKYKKIDVKKEKKKSYEKILSEIFTKNKLNKYTPKGKFRQLSEKRGAQRSAETILITNKVAKKLHIKIKKIDDLYVSLKKFPYTFEIKRGGWAEVWRGGKLIKKIRTNKIKRFRSYIKNREIINFLSEKLDLSKKDAKNFLSIYKKEKRAQLQKLKKEGKINYINANLKFSINTMLQYLGADIES